MSVRGETKPLVAFDDEGGAMSGNFADSDVSDEAKALSIQIELNLALRLEEQGKFDEAVGLYSGICERVPGYANAHYLLAKASFRLGAHDDAYHAFKVAIELDATNGGYWWDFCACLFQMKHYDAALIAIDKAIVISPGSNDLHARRSGVLCYLKRYDEAHIAIDLAISNVPEAYVPELGKYLINKANVYEFEGELKKAMELYRLGLEKAPRNAFALGKVAKLGELATLDKIGELEGA